MIKPAFRTTLLAVAVSFLSAGLQAENSTDLANKSFLLRTHKDFGSQYLIDGGKSVDSVTLSQLAVPEIMAASIFIYENNQIKLAKVGADEQQWCLAGSFSAGTLFFDVCEEGADDQFFEFALKNHQLGTYVIKHGNQCVTKADSGIKLELCTLSPAYSARQEFTPSLVTDQITYTLANENSGNQNVVMSYQQSDVDNLWIKRTLVLGKSSATVLMPDFTSYGLDGQIWINNTTYRSPIVSSDDRAGDIVTLTMPMKGDITKRTIVASAPTITSSYGTDLRIFDDQGDLANIGTQSITTWNIPEGWILNVYPNANYQGGYTPVTSTGPISKNLMPHRVGSIAIVQRGHLPVRMQGNNGDLGALRMGEYDALNSDGMPAFYQKTSDTIIKHVGPMDSGKDTEVGSIRAFSDSFDTKAASNAFYLRKQKSSSSTPFTDRSVWEPLNVGGWLSDDTGFRGELYYVYRHATNQSAIWRLKQNGEARSCFPESGSDGNWKLLGYVFGEMDSHYGDDVEGVRLYTSKDYTGDELTITESIADLCHMGNAVSSYEIPQGWEVQFFTGKNYTGKMYTRTGRSTTLGGFDKRIQSIRITRQS